MIIKINFKNNDFEEEMRKYMEKFRWHELKISFDY